MACLASGLPADSLGLLHGLQAARPKCLGIAQRACHCWLAPILSGTRFEFAATPKQGPLAPKSIAYGGIPMNVPSTRWIWGRGLGRGGRAALDSPPLPFPLPHQLAGKTPNLLQHEARQVDRGEGTQFEPLR